MRLGCDARVTSLCWLIRCKGGRDNGRGHLLRCLLNGGKVRLRCRFIVLCGWSVDHTDSGIKIITSLINHRLILDILCSPSKTKEGVNVLAISQTSERT